MKYEGIKLTGTPENIKAITEKLEVNESLLSFIKGHAAKRKDQYLIFHPEAARKFDAIIDQGLFDKNFSSTKELNDTEFVKLEEPVDEFHKKNKKFKY